MTGAISQHSHFKSALLPLLLVLASLSPLLVSNVQVVSLFDEPQIASNAPFSLASGYGHEIAGTTVTVDELDNAVVREESILDFWSSVELNNSSIEHHGTPDMKLTRTDKEHYCWSTEEGSIRTAVHRSDGFWSSFLVDTVSQTNTSTLVDCAIAVTANELPRLLYADGANLKMARFAAQSATYWEGPRWHTRTIFVDANPTHLALDITPGGVEWGLMRTNTGALWQVNFSGAFWTTFLLDAGPVGEDFELSIDQQSIAHVLYSRTTTSEVVLMRIDGFNRDVRILARDPELVDALGMDLDANDVEQIATATQSGSTFTLNLIRSLSGQDSGRVNPVPTDTREGQENVNEGLMFLADFNADGFDDLVIATPDADSAPLTKNGLVEIFYGSNLGLESTASSVMFGDVDNALFGQSMDVGDFNDDGIADLAVGSPFWYQGNMTNSTSGQVSIYLGSTSGVSATPWWTLNGTDDELFGSTLTTLTRDGRADSMAIGSHGYQIEVSPGDIHTGKVNIYDGSDVGMVHVRNITQSKVGAMFGRALEGCDINADGEDELIVTNTGSYADSITYSSIEYFYGNTSGYSGTPDVSLESNVQGKLFGYNVVCVDDINGDGYQDHIITEPYNTTTGVFGTGVLWLYQGKNTTLTSTPDWQYFPTIANTKIGEAIASAGDINEDGYGDVYMTSRMGSQSGRLEIFLGSSSGLRSDKQLLAEGIASQQLGYRLAANGDINGDGLSEIVYSKRTSIGGSNYVLEYSVLTEQDWESISFDYSGEIDQLDLGTAARGETSLAFSHQSATVTTITKLEHMNDGTPAGQWVSQTLCSLFTSNLSLQFQVRSSGQPYLLTEDQESIVLHTTSSMTAVEREIATTGTMGQYLGSTVNHDNEQVLAYTSGSGQQIFLSQQTASGWTTGLVRNSAGLANGVEVLVDNNNTPLLVYRHNATSQLELARGGGSWTLTSLGSEGEVRSLQHPAVVLENDTVAIALIASNGVGTDLAVWMYDGQILTKQTIANLSDMSAQLAITTLSNGSILVSSLTSTGNLKMYELWPGDVNWQSHSLPQPTGSLNQYRLDLEGGDLPVLAIRANAASSIMMMNSTGGWDVLTQRPAAAVNGAWDIVEVDGHLLLLTSDPTTNHLIVNTLEIAAAQQGAAPWISMRFGDVKSSFQVDARIDDNGTIHLAYWDVVDDDVISLKLYKDQDRDLVFDLIDALPKVGNQWKNSDGDNFGDNPLGPLADACVGVNGVSSFVKFGCADYDVDGYADSIDACNQVGGTSWIDRFGCDDIDQDGWSDNGVNYFDGDVFKANWKQTLDSDGDGFGDNHGYDCCTTELDPNAGPGDLFPYLASQYADYDGDGYGDNDTDTVYGDFCPWEFGLSWRDRNGCLDTDGDGASDPSGNGTAFEWNAEENGADMWPLDATQWKDTDGDGYGDNQSDGATNPDHFPFRAAAANDTDGDGYADNWTPFYNGTNAQGIQIDACPLVWGNSSIPVIGCLDSDGDGFTDQYSYDLNSTNGLRENQLGDAFPFIKSQYLDTDGDGFGDNPLGIDADKCPYEAGVREGTNGVGCRVVDLNDNDGDGVINDLDTLCPNSPPGEMVNAQGCAQSELDDDEDGVRNNADRCANTPAGSVVDIEGCTGEQRTTDSDGDGYYDPVDNCPNTPSGETVDQFGCAESQRDSDGDGISDVDDECDDTPHGFPILPDGCTDFAALVEDIDGDGYAGLYTYDIDPITLLHVNETGDAFPSDPTQWFDRDGDGYGDNASGQEADHCPDEAGTSYLDFFGCYDDGDGWWDENETPSLRDNPTQWKDSDFDGFGDNWGDASWTAHRDPSWPGMYIEGATNADMCPKTTIGLTVDEVGCHPSERDSDFDGVMDNADNCPTQPKGEDGYEDGCPLVVADDGTEFSLFGMNLTKLLPIVAGGIVGLFLLIFIVSRLIRGGKKDEDEYEDDYEDDEEEESFLTKLDRQRSTTARDLASPEPRTIPSSPSRSDEPNRGPSSAGPPGRAPSSAAGPPGRAPSSAAEPSGAKPGGPPQKGPNSPPNSGPSGPQRTGGPPPSKTSSPAPTVAKKKSVTNIEVAQKTKVRKAKIQVDMSVFEDWQAADRESAVDWVVSAMHDGEQERTILMQLQETGWSAEQSRAICNLATNKAA